MQLKSGTLLQGGKYRIEKVLGQGGFGITYLAVQIGLNRKVAVKEFFMKEHCNRDKETSYVSLPSGGSQSLVEKFRVKFIKEAQTIADMDNQHIVRIHDVFEENGTAYYVMEYLSCGSLSDRIPSDGLPEFEALGYIRQVADALSYIHKNKILHLDIKPSNILFRKADEAVLIDFGISKHYDEVGGGQTSSTPVGVSRGYAPLEQYKCGGVSQFSPATDIYSLGATLYKLLTGQTPPDADEVNEDGLPDLPHRVSVSSCEAVEKAMSSRRKDRPQSVAEFMELLEVAGVSADETEIITDVVSQSIVHVISGDKCVTLVSDLMGLCERETIKRKLVSQGYDYKNCRLITPSSAIALAHTASSDDSDQVLLTILVEQNAVSLSLFDCGDGVIETLYYKRLREYTTFNIESRQEYYQQFLSDLVSEYKREDTPLNVVIYDSFGGSCLDLWKPKMNALSVGYVDDAFIKKGMAVLASIFSGECMDLLLIDITRSGYRLQFADVGMEWLVNKNVSIPARRSVVCAPRDPNHKRMALRLWEENGDGRICVLDHTLTLPDEYNYDENVISATLDIDSGGEVFFEVSIGYRKQLCRFPVTHQVRVESNDDDLPVLSPLLEREA